MLLDNSSCDIVFLLKTKKSNINLLGIDRKILSNHIWIYFYSLSNSVIKLFSTDSMAYDLVIAAVPSVYCPLVFVIRYIYPELKR